MSTGNENGNEAAFPLSPDLNKELGYNPGLTKREYFAAMAFQALIPSYKYENGITPTVKDIEYIAVISVNAADALLNQLNQK